MNQFKLTTVLILCIAVFGYVPPVLSAVKQLVPNIDTLWRQYLANAAGNFPAVRFPYDRCFRSAAKKYDLPLTLLLAVARGESNFNPRAMSDRNCHGLMQIRWPGTARHLGIYRLKALYEPCTNIRAGARYLRELMDRYNGNLHLALAAYNYGPGRVRIGATSNQVPRGANWYSGYIYHHLKYIIQESAPGITQVPDKPKVYSRPRRLALITFRQPYRANAYYQYLQKRAPSLNLDWYRIGMGRYQVVMLYSDSKTLESGRKKLKNLGIVVGVR